MLKKVEHKLNYLVEARTSIAVSHKKELEQKE